MCFRLFLWNAPGFISKPHSITAESRMADRKERWTGLLQSPGRVPPRVWQHYEEQARYRPRVRGFSRLREQAFQPALTLDPMPCCSPTLHRWKAVKGELKAPWMRDGRQMQESGRLRKWRAFTWYWSAALCWCSDNKWYIKGLLPHAIMSSSSHHFYIVRKEWCIHAILKGGTFHRFRSYLLPPSRFCSWFFCVCFFVF